MCQLHTASKPPTLKQALASLLVAEKLFDSSGKATAATPLEPRWGHDSCLAFIGRAHELLGQLEDARNYFRKALALHPGNHVAREGLKRVSKPD
jgi:tetratricopeptide (TPR) repeat protein